MKSKKANNRESVQIIAGEYRSRPIAFIEADNLRPTVARIRETLFNWLAPVIYDKTCLDLFAGSGILGFEALSRGASHVTFVEKNRHVSKQIQQNIQTLKVANAAVINADYLQAFKGQYDVVFLDPPYSLNLLPTLIEQIDMIAPEYIFVEDNRPIAQLVEINPNYELIKSKKAGRIHYGLLQSIKA